MMMLISSLLETEAELSLFETLYYDHRKLVKHIALRYLDDDALAEDAAQETMLKVARYIKKFEGLEAPQCAALISVIAKNCALTLLKSEQRQHGATTEGEPRAKPQPCPSLRLAVDSLPDTLREPLILRFYYGFSAAEIAALLNITLPATHKRIDRAKAALRNMLGEEGTL